ncbi:FAD-binding oxidoreductase [Phyllobacterium salinisoli]|uniref:FAD-binding oxidoreductase n=1 Tax=Phyllobacterium salinisoli TaxID=1899321 RepID=A0A368K852_9HYPH|nr:FAD-binding oxidoreductase [Phyllobacterium salinisoli]RCS25401.1 FAD-binding oxidoreductase [Phyllobacterium salinisoli]
MSFDRFGDNSGDRFGESFGRIERKPRRAVSFAGAERSLQDGSAAPGSLLGFGNGRSYGDSCHNDRGALVEMRPKDRILGFDAASGIIEAEAGVLLAEIIAFAAPHGYFLPVTPGTRFVTLGGAIANDVHGKNHHRRGTFGCHVVSFELLRSDGTTVSCAPLNNEPLFAATIGGMGLTGLISTARIRLMRVASLDVEERITRFADLDQFFELAEKADEANEYAVAWIDQIARGARAGRGLLLTGNHAGNGNFTVNPRPTRLRVPFELPFSALNRPSLTLFNAAYLNLKGRGAEPHLTGYERFFYPLDGMRDWNRLYGPAGLYQHQSVIPYAQAPDTIPAMLEATRKAGEVSFLTVLKRFGTIGSPGLLSFPQPGYTLTLDFPNRGAGTLALLSELDRLTIAAGGRVNPYKDQRMSPATFAASFPHWKKLEEHRDPAFSSNFWQRTAMALV